MRERHHPRGLADTSVIIDLEQIEPGELPEQVAISAVTMAELAAGPHATADLRERARRQERLQRAESVFEVFPVDARVARAYGMIYATTLAAGQKPRGRRAFDLLIAATALSAGLPLYTRDPADFRELEELIDVVSVTVL